MPAGIFALLGPTLGGWFADNLSWQYLYWIAAPLLIACLVMVLIGVPSPAKRIAHKIDVRGCMLVAVASSTMIIGLSFAGDGLLGVSLIFWILFLRAEIRSEEPVLDPQVLRNRTFITVVCHGFHESMESAAFSYPMGGVSAGSAGFSRANSSG